MRKNKTLLVSGLAGLMLAGGVAGVALAERGPGGHHGPRDPEKMFEMLDLNGDGEITREEAENARAARFGEIDTDGDEKISAEEMQAHMTARIEQHQQRMFERHDENKDGFLSADEMGPRGDRHERMFDRADANDDGKITREEMEEMHERMRERRGHHGDR